MPGTVAARSPVARRSIAAFSRPSEPVMSRLISHAASSRTDEMAALMVPRRRMVARTATSTSSR